MATNGELGVIINEVIVDYEGGWVYSDRADDPDRGTYAGVTYDTYAEYAARKNWEVLSPSAFKRDAQAKTPYLTALVLEIMIEDYVRAPRFDVLQLPYKRVYVNIGINIHPTKAIMLMQETHNEMAKKYFPSLLEQLKVDGKMGPKSLAQFAMWQQNGSVQSVNYGKIFANKFLDNAQGYYAGLVRENARAWRKFADEMELCAKMPNDTYESEFKEAQSKRPKVLRAESLKGWLNRTNNLRVS